MRKLDALPAEATSSLHTDLKNNKAETELHALTGYMVTEAHRLGISVPTYDMMYADLCRNSHGRLMPRTG